MKYKKNSYKWREGQAYKRGLNTGLLAGIIAMVAIGLAGIL